MRATDTPSASMISRVHHVFESARAFATDKVDPARTNTVVSPSLTARIVKFIGSTNYNWRGTQYLTRA